MTGSPEPLIECVYCGKARPVTADHVPPKCLFPRPRPRLITVPACAQCNTAFSRDDEYFRIAVVAPALDYHPAAQELWKELMRGLRRRPALRTMLVSEIQSVEVRTPAGLYAGEAKAIGMDGKRIRLVIERIVRGLLWHHHGSRPVAGSRIMTRNNPDVRPVLSILSEDLVLSGVGGDIFRYRHGRAQDGPDYSMWWLCFFMRSTFLTIVEPPETD